MALAVYRDTEPPARLASREQVALVLHLVIGEVLEVTQTFVPRVATTLTQPRSLGAMRTAFTVGEHSARID
jgi:hypothetical protein